MASGTNQNLYAVWCLQANWAYAVGTWGTILLYDGTGWYRMPSGASGGGYNVGTVAFPYGTSRHLNGIWASAWSDIWVVGANGTILHFDGTGWTTVPSGTQQHLFDVWGFSPSNVVAVGTCGTILHYGGSAWVPMIGFSCPQHLNGVWGFSGSELYIVGTGGTFIHFNGAYSCQTTAISSQNLFSVWGVHAGDVYAVGDQETILHHP
jgi:hypothetical protein